MNRKDFLLIAILIIIAGGCYLILGKGISGDQVRIVLDGKQYGIYDLNVDQEIMVKSKNGYNLVRIENHKVFVAEADCPNQNCVKQGKTDNQHKTLVCLPHDLVVEVQSSSYKKTNDIDVIVQ